jgi:hypothetical protein
MTIAEQVHKIVSDGDTAAATLYGGYRMKLVIKSDGSLSFKRELFPPAKVIDNERRNRDGRVTMCCATYEDGSRLIFTWSHNIGPRYHLGVPAEGITC